MTFDPQQVRIAAALSRAITDAEALVDARNFGPELHAVVRHARALHDLFLEQIGAANPGVIDRLHAISDAMNGNVRGLEDLVRIPPTPACDSPPRLAASRLPFTRSLCRDSARSRQRAAIRRLRRRCQRMPAP